MSIRNNKTRKILVESLKLDGGYSGKTEYMECKFNSKSQRSKEL